MTGGKKSFLSVSYLPSEVEITWVLTQKMSNMAPSYSWTHWKNANLIEALQKAQGWYSVTLVSGINFNCKRAKSPNKVENFWQVVISFYNKKWFITKIKMYHIQRVWRREIITNDPLVHLSLLPFLILGGCGRVAGCLLNFPFYGVGAHSKLGT